MGYHRLRGDGIDPYGIEVSAETLRAQLRTIRDRARPVRLVDLARGLRDGMVEDRSVAVTIDDAYADTVSVLPELIRDLGIPVTVFVPTGLTGLEPWWDELDRILAVPGRLPAALSVESGGWALRRDLDSAEQSDPGARRRLVVDVYDHLRGRPASHIRDILPRLAHWAGGESGGTRSTVASLGLLRDLAATDGFDIGSHSATHPFLADLPREEQQRELEESRGFLEEALGSTVELFSYPNGSFSEATMELVAGSGYVGACSSRPDVVTSLSNRLALPRFWPGDDPHEVSRMLRLWL